MATLTIRPTFARFSLRSETQRGISALPGSVGEFLLAPRPNRGLGSTMATLVDAGFEVTGCRQDRAEIEDAFLALATDGES